MVSAITVSEIQDELTFSGVAKPLLWLLSITCILVQFIHVSKPFLYQGRANYWSSMIIRVFLEIWLPSTPYLSVKTFHQFKTCSRMYKTSGCAFFDFIQINHA